MFSERLLATQNPLSQADRPHQLFADAPPPPTGAGGSQAAPPPPPPSMSSMPPRKYFILRLSFNRKHHIIEKKDIRNIEYFDGT